MKLSTFGRVARNSISISTALIIKRISHFVLYILIARHLGVEVFGQFSLVYSLFLIFEIPGTFGLGNLIIREVAKRKSEFGKYLINGHFIVLLASLACFGVWVLLVHVMGYSSEVIKGSYLMALALIPMAMGLICESIFRAFERMQFIVYALGVASLVKLVLAWVLLSRGYGYYSIIGLLVVIQWVMLLLEWYFIVRFFSKPSWGIDLSFCRQLAKVSTTFFGIGIFTDLFLRLNVIVLGWRRGDVEVGFYNAAFQLTFIFMVISKSITSAVYPVLSRTFINNRSRFKQYSERSTELLISVALPMAVFFSFLSGSILLVYREEFVTAAPILRVLVWMLLPLSFTRILGGILLASGNQRPNFIIALVNTVSIMVLSYALVTPYGGFGAGLAMLIGMCISFIQHYAVVSKKVFTINIPKVVWKPLVASLALAGFLFLTIDKYHLLLVLPIAMVMYLGIVLGLHLLCGTLPIFRREYLVGPGPEIEVDESGL